MLELILVYSDKREERKKIVSKQDFQDAIKIMEKFQDGTQTDLISATLNMSTGS